jgi:large subunit ribosomal protein L21
MSDSEKTIETPEEPTSKPKTKKSAAKTDAAQSSGYAVIETGGKQYRVSVGDRISVEHLRGDETEVTIDRVLLLGGDGKTQVGTPVVKGATVTATIDDHFRGEKIHVFKYKAKKRYRRKIGHRQLLTHLTITGINA